FIDFLLLLSLRLPGEHESQRAASPAENQQRDFGQACEHENAKEARGDGQGTRVVEQLSDKLGRQIGLLRAAGDEQAGGQRNEKGGHLADKSVADGELRENLGGVGKRQPLLSDADDKAADNVDERDD